MFQSFLTHGHGSTPLTTVARGTSLANNCDLEVCMASQDRPNQNANKTKAEGDRWSSEQDTVKKVDYDIPAENYPADDGDNAGGITNRPLDEEVDNQESLPTRGMSRDESRDQLDDESEMDREARRGET
jgi:hypothetical protein